MEKFEFKKLSESAQDFAIDQYIQFEASVCWDEDEFPRLADQMSFFIYDNMEREDKDVFKRYAYGITNGFCFHGSGEGFFHIPANPELEQELNKKYDELFEEAQETIEDHEEWFFDKDRIRDILENVLSYRNYNSDGEIIHC